MNGMNVNNGKSISGIEHLKQSIRDILTTPVGSRVMRRDYGCNLFKYTDNPLSPGVIADIISETAIALNAWEPRIGVKTVTVEKVGNGSLSLNISGVYKPDGKPILLEGIQIK